MQSLHASTHPVPCGLYQVQPKALSDTCTTQATGHQAHAHYRKHAHVPKHTRTRVRTRKHTLSHYPE